MFGDFYLIYMLGIGGWEEFGDFFILFFGEENIC